MHQVQRNLVLLGSAVALAVGPIALRAQDAATPTTQPAGSIAANPLLITKPAGSSLSTAPTTQISLNFQDAPIDTVLERLSDEAGFVILKPGPAPIPGRVTARSTQPVTAAEAVALLNTVLMANGYTAIQQGRILKIVAVADARKGGIPVHFGADPDQIQPTDELITQVIPLRNVDAVKLKSDLTPLIPVNADLSSNAASNSLIMTDTQANILRVVEIVANLDKRDTLENSIKVRQLKYADATAAAKLITDIFKSDTSSTAGAAANPFAGGPGAFFRAMRGGGGGPGGGGGGGGGGGQDDSEKAQIGRITASADTRTNTVVITGPTDTLKVIDTMLDQLDANPAADQDFFIYKVLNGQAADIQATLNNLFGNGSTGSTPTNTNQTNNAFGTGSTFGSGSSGSTFGRSGSAGGSGGFGGSSGGSGGGGSSFGSSFGSTGSSTGTGNRGGGGGGGGASSLFGGQTNGPVSAVSELKGQVYVVADTDTNSLLVATASKYDKQVRDILKELDRPVPQVLIKVLIAEVTHDNSLDAGIDFSVLNLRPSGKGQSGGTIFGNALAATAAQSTGAGGMIVSLMEDNFTATLRALATVGKVDVLSRPYILASDNQQASILVGQEVPIITNSQTTDTGNIINNISYQSIGIILNVTPHINPDGLVIMDVAPQISAISNSTVPISSNVNAPIFDNRSAQSRVGIRDGDTIVIGGLMQDQKTQTLSKVPFLGDIPGLGLLFQRNQTDLTKTELLIFLTPHVAAQAQRLKPMSQDEMKGMKVTPNAVEPGDFQEQMRGMDRGGLTTQPTTVPQPTEPPPPQLPRTGTELQPRFPGGN
jgi:general secretion pathway protein D